MKKIYLILVFVFAITAVIGTANARVKCVPLVGGDNQTIGIQTTCTGDPNLYVNYIDWAAECTTHGVTSEVKGVGLCSNQLPESCAKGNCDRTWADPTMRSQTITTSDNVNDNGFCWCKMTTPAVSLWVFRGADSDICATYCAALCTDFVQDPVKAGPPFRSALFSNMTD